MQQDAVKEAIAEGRRRIDLTNERPFNHELLGFPFRNIYAKRKRVFMKLLIIFANKKYPDPDIHPCTGNWTESISKAFDKLIKYATYNTPFWKACKRIVKGEFESDSLYRDPMLMMLESVIEDILDNKFPARGEDMPSRIYWEEPTPYGGKHTIIYKLIQHRVKINDLLGRQNNV